MKLSTTILGTQLDFELVRHGLDVEPTGASKLLAYVGFPESSVIKQARWRCGEWRDHRGQPFGASPDCWFSVELPSRG